MHSIHVFPQSCGVDSQGQKIAGATVDRVSDSSGVLKKVLCKQINQGRKQRNAVSTSWKSHHVARQTTDDTSSGAISGVVGVLLPYIRQHAHTRRKIGSVSENRCDEGGVSSSSSAKTKDKVQYGKNY